MGGGRRHDAGQGEVRWAEVEWAVTGARGKWRREGGNADAPWVGRAKRRVAKRRCEGVFNASLLVQHLHKVVPQ